MESRVLNDWQIQIVMALGRNRLRSSELKAIVDMSNHIRVRETKRLIDMGIIEIETGFGGTTPNIKFHTLTEKGLEILDFLIRIQSILDGIEEVSQ